MKKILTLLLTTLIIISTIFLSGCGSNNTLQQEKIEKDIREVSLSDVSTHSEVIQDIIKNLKTEEEKIISSSHKIEQELEQGKISKEESIKLELLAGFYPEKLPSKYKGDDSKGMSNLQDTLMWIQYNWGNLDAKTQKELEPFYVSIRDPKSHVQQDDTNKFVEALTIIPAVSATTYSTDTISIGGKDVVGVQYESRHTGQSVDVEKAVKKSWPIFKSFFGLLPDEPIRILIKDPLTPNGVTTIVELEGKDMCDIHIRAGLGEKLTQSTVAHELFHCFQLHIPLKYNETSTKWLMEATAVWAEHYVYPDYNQEFIRLPGLFYSLSTDTIRYGLDMEYQTYVFFLYLTQKTGNENIVKEMLFDAETKTGRKVVSELPKLNEYFGEYVLWNWNKDEWHLYKDYPTFPEEEYRNSNMFPSGKSINTKYYQDNKEYIEEDERVPLSAKYNMQVFADDIDKITYTFETVGDDSHRMQALVSINGNWRYEDWTGVTEKNFCKTSPTEDIEAVVLIVSNADANNNYKVKYNINTKEECEKKWRGTLRIKWDASDSSSFSGLGGKGSITKSVYRGEYVSNEVLEEDEGDMEIISQTITYNSEKYTNVDGTGNNCGWKNQFTGTTSSGTVVVDNTNERYKDTRWSYELDDDDHKTENIWFEAQHFEPEQEWGERTHTVRSEWVPCDTSLPPKIENQLTTNKLRSLESFGESFDIIVDPDSKVLKGEYVIETGSDGVGDFDILVQYDYVYG